MLSQTNCHAALLPKTHRVERSLFLITLCTEIVLILFQKKKKEMRHASFNSSNQRRLIEHTYFKIENPWTNLSKALRTFVSTVINWQNRRNGGFCQSPEIRITIETPYRKRLDRCRRHPSSCREHNYRDWLSIEARVCSSVVKGRPACIDSSIP